MAINYTKKIGKIKILLTNIHASSVRLLILISRKQQISIQAVGCLRYKIKSPYVKLAKTFGYTQIN